MLFLYATICAAIVAAAALCLLSLFCMLHASRSSDRAEGHRKVSLNLREKNHALCDLNDSANHEVRELRADLESLAKSLADQTTELAKSERLSQGRYKLAVEAMDTCSSLRGVLDLLRYAKDPIVIRDDVLVSDAADAADSRVDIAWC